MLFVEIMQKWSRNFPIKHLNFEKYHWKTLTGAIRQVCVGFFIQFYGQFIFFLFQEAGRFVFDQFGLSKTLFCIQFPGLCLALKFLQCYRIFNRCIWRDFKALMAFFAERIFWLDDQSAQIQYFLLDSLSQNWELIECLAAISGDYIVFTLMFHLCRSVLAPSEHQEWSRRLELRRWRTMHHVHRRLGLRTNQPSELIEKCSENVREMSFVSTQFKLNNINFVLTSHRRSIIWCLSWKWLFDDASQNATICTWAEIFWFPVQQFNLLYVFH